MIRRTIIPARAGLALAAVLAFAVTLPAGAATRTITIKGNLASSVNGCFNISVLFTGADCSYARTRDPALALGYGPAFFGAYYPLDWPGTLLNWSPAPGDGKFAPPVTGSITFDDNGTPGDAGDDRIGATWVIGAAAHLALTGNGDRGVERWSSWTQVMPATPVNSATALPGGGVEYVIGSRGKPTPEPLCAAVNTADCFPSEAAPGNIAAADFWSTAFLGLPNPATNRNGIERSPAFALYDTVSGPRPNIGGQTTGTFAGYECLDNAGDNDCTVSEFLAGSSLPNYRTESGPVAYHPATGDCADGVDNDLDGFVDRAAGNADPQCVSPAGPPGFDNVVLVLATDASGNVTRANAYWTREFIVAVGPAAAGDPPGVYTVDNSYSAGRISFASAVLAANDAVTTSNDLAVEVDALANDTGFADPVTVDTWTPAPQHGTVAVQGSPGPRAGVRLVYTPEPGFHGMDTFGYVVDDGSGVGFAVVTVTVLDDPDQDGIEAGADNCLAVANADQRDTDGDGYGNLCDADLNNSGGIVNFADLALFRAAFGTADPNADLNGNGIVNFADLALFRLLFGQAPGPSGTTP